MTKLKGKTALMIDTKHTSRPQSPVYSKQI